jgi:hypothetical protein
MSAAARSTRDQHIAGPRAFAQRARRTAAAMARNDTAKTDIVKIDTAWIDTACMMPFRRTASHCLSPRRRTSFMAQCKQSNVTFVRFGLRSL